MMMSDYLFVYGTLMRSADHEMGQLLARNAEYVDEAIFQGRLYLIETYPGVVPSEDPADKIFGEVYRLQHATGVLAELDRYEACGAGFSEPTEYVREIRLVQLAAGGTLEANIYVYNWPVQEQHRIPSGRFTGVRIS
jgi:gamma-glutamylcyclotransferase (GGCT)/AIG2-like uncharacterized protein YtfP